MGSSFLAFLRKRKNGERGVATTARLCSSLVLGGWCVSWLRVVVVGLDV